MVGIAGKNVQTGVLPKIIGLDPANPLFNYREPATRIAVGDALSVETIHTNAGTLGFSAPLGDATFYPNGGRSQPGCGIDLVGTCVFCFKILRQFKTLAGWNLRTFESS